MSKNRKLRATSVRILGVMMDCETVADYGRDHRNGYWHKLVIINGERVEVRCKQKRGTFERIPDEET